MSSLYQEYEAYLDKYIKEYGKMTIVLYQCGSFYEIYSDGDNDKVNIKEIGDLLNIQISRRNKSIIEVNKSNTLMCGFPDYTLNKFLNILVDNNYTVVVVSQVSPPPKPLRKVTQIVSSGTRINDNLTYETNNLISIYFEDIDKNMMAIGLSLIDLSTGISKVYETSSKLNDFNYCLDDIYRLLIIYNPKETVIFGKTRLEYDFIINYLELTKKNVHNKLHLFPDEYTQIVYQNQILKKTFKMKSLLSPIEYIELERTPFALISYIMLIQFSYNHNDQILNKIQLPEIINENDKLILSYNAHKHLNIEHLHKILNTCSTSIGKRYFKERLYNPLNNRNKLIESWNITDELLLDKKYQYISNTYLINIYDLERLFRKINLNIIHPADFLQIGISFKNIINTIDYLSSFNNNINSIIINNWNILYKKSKELIEYYTKIFNETEIQKYHLDNISQSFFNNGTDIDIDNLQSELKYNEGFYKEYIDFLNKDNPDFFKVEQNERDGYYLSITSKRFLDNKKNILKSIFKWNNIEINGNELTNKTVSQSNNNFKIFHPYFKILNDKIIIIKEKLSKYVLEKYLNIIKEFDDKFNDIFKLVITYIQKIDYYCTCAKNAFNYKYYRPIIDSTKYESSYAIFKDIRHPIVERIQQNIQYISNDIEIGENGILFFGINSAGKSTLMKSIGISIIMAQCGMFVPCSSMIFNPYNKIFTRIPSGDDIIKGQSTFTIEVSELRSILKRTDSNSLVIGDELCSGTESVSALSIVSAGIVDLCKKKCSFIFATHLHDITSISYIKSLSNLKIYHLSVIYDENNDKLIYNRKLKEGQGNELYGLEVCKSLNMGNDFLLLANDIRKEILNINSYVLNTKTSTYNSQKYIDLCEICQEKCDDVHHISEQILSDLDGYIGTFHKNNTHNLICVCKSCHNKIHNKKLEIEGFKQTSNGVELEYKNIEEKDITNEDKLIKKILDLKKSGMTISNIILNLKDEKITRYKINKIISQYKIKS